MEFVVRTPVGKPADVVTVTDEVIAGQRVGNRLTFAARHDLTVQFANGAAIVEDIDLVLYIVPSEFFCYRGDDFVFKFVLDARCLTVDHRPSVGGVNAQAIINAE